MWWKNFESHDEMKTRKFKYSSGMQFYLTENRYLMMNINDEIEKQESLGNETVIRPKNIRWVP